MMRTAILFWICILLFIMTMHIHDGVKALERIAAAQKCVKP